MNLSTPARVVLAGGAMYVGVQVGLPSKALSNFMPSHAIGTVQAATAASTNTVMSAPVTIPVHHDQLTGRAFRALPPGTLNALYSDSSTSIRLA